MQVIIPSPVFLPRTKLPSQTILFRISYRPRPWGLESLHSPSYQNIFSLKSSPNLNRAPFPSNFPPLHSPLKYAPSLYTQMHEPSALPFTTGPQKKWWWLSCRKREGELAGIWGEEEKSREAVWRGVGDDQGKSLSFCRCFTVSQASLILNQPLQISKVYLSYKDPHGQR